MSAVRWTKFRQIENQVTVQEQIEYAVKHHAEAVKSAKESAEWIQALYKSLQ